MDIAAAPRRVGTTVSRRCIPPVDPGYHPAASPGRIISPPQPLLPNAKSL